LTREADRGLTSRVESVEIEWPRSLGYCGSSALAVAFEVIEPPLALIMAAVPFVEMLDLPRASRPVRLISQLADGATQPVGGVSEQTVRLTTPPVSDAAHDLPAAKVAKAAAT